MNDELAYVYLTPSLIVFNSHCHLQAEAEVKNLNSKIILLEEDNGKQEEALGDTRRRLETIEVEADENLRYVHFSVIKPFKGTFILF